MKRQTFGITNPEGELILTIPGNGSHPTGLSWSPDGQRLAVAKRFGESAIYDMEGNHVSIAFHEGGVGGVAISPDGNLVATAGLDAKIKISRIGISENKAKGSCRPQCSRRRCGFRLPGVPTVSGSHQVTTPHCDFGILTALRPGLLFLPPAHPL